MKKQFWILIALLISVQGFAREKAPHPVPEGRERIRMNSQWRFALGHARDAEKDFDHGTAYFSYFAKAGYGD
ncbi:MAG TPA: hypothetical protein ENN17_09925, partial [bacterium]|nr:hypothetical protein [bacterium]